jgi:hypothetical protein
MVTITKFERTPSLLRTTAEFGRSVETEMVNKPDVKRGDDKAICEGGWFGFTHRCAP